MPRFAANLSMMYNEVGFLERFAAAAKDGFEAVEFLFPYAHSRSDLAARLADNGLAQVLFNAPPGDWDGGERGMACLPGREAQFREGVDLALEFATALKCPRIHLMAGLAPAAADRAKLRATYVANLAWAAKQAASAAVDVLIEPINTRDIPRFFLNRQDEAHAIVSEVGAPNLKVQMDLYHCQIVEGDLVRRIERWLPGVGHFQIAGVPDRHEPDEGEVNYEYLFEVLERLGWDGHIGCEYRPRAGTSEGLGWLRAYRAI
jgi:hydroxypyruvate isomerase